MDDPSYTFLSLISKSITGIKSIKKMVNIAWNPCRISMTFRSAFIRYFER